MPPELSVGLLGERAFTMGDQAAFAAFSGDRNPIHLDPLYARRCLGGRIIVHGMQTLMWALDCWARGRNASAVIERLGVRFVRAATLESPLTCCMSDANGPTVKIEVTSQSGTIALIEVVARSGAALRSADFRDGEPPDERPLDSQISDLKEKSGTLALQMEKRRAAQLFPSLVATLGETLPAVLACSSRLVGMECPGLNSLYSEIELAVSSDVPAGPLLHYDVERIDQRFNLVTMRVRGAGLSGRISAFLRPGSTRQASMQEARASLSGAKFDGQRALVVGGSRGLGELTSKLLAAGGADVCLSYRDGREDAENVANEITAAGCLGTAISLDIQAPFHPESAFPKGWMPTDLYYFASPAIFSGTRATFSDELFSRFCAYYVSGFARLVEPLCATGLTAAFYPSTAALDELPADMAEYCAAKAGGETLCRVLEKRHRGLRIYAPRIPRVATDQTVSLLPVRNLDPLPVMLRLLKDFRAGRKDSAAPEISVSQGSSVKN